MPSGGSITIAGNPILVDVQCQLKQFLGDRLPPEDILFARWQSNPLRANPFSCDNAPDYVDSPYPPLPTLKIGELQWPSGASRHARALYAVDWLTLRAIATDAWGWEPPTELIDPEGDPDDLDNQQEVAPTDIPDSWGTVFYDVELKVEGEETFTADMFALRPYRVTGNGIDCWLLPLVDARWKMAHRAFSPLAEKPEDADTLIEDIADAAGATIIIDTALIDGEIDERLWKAEQPAVSLLDAACLSQGLRVIRDPDGTLRAVNPTRSNFRRDSRLSQDWQILSGGTRGPTELPLSIKVHCRQEGDTKFHVESAIVPGGITVGGVPLAVWSSWLKNADNATETAAFAAQIASSIAAWSNSGGQYCLAGPIDFVPTGFDDFVSILLEERSPDHYVFRTTVRELPGVFMPRAILIGGVLDCCDTQDDHFLFTLFDYLEGDRASAEIRTMDDMVQVEASASVVNTLSHFSHLGIGDRGICVKVDGIYYVVHPEGAGSTTAAGARGVVFTLTSNLGNTVSNTATATVLISGVPGVTSGDSITVYNTGNKKAFSTAVGWAIRIGSQYWVAEVNQNALLAIGTLSSDTHDISGLHSNNGSVARQQTTTVSALVASSTYPHSFIPETLPNLSNPSNVVGISGDKVLVTYNETTDTWDILDVWPAIARRIRFKLTANWPSGLIATSTSTTAIATLSRGDLPAAGFSLNDRYSEAMNAKNNDEGEAEYNYVTEGWEIQFIFHTATLVRGKLAANFSSTPSTFTVTPEIAINGILPSGTLTVQNIFGWTTGTINKKVAIVWNPTDEQWEPWQMGCP